MVKEMEKLEGLRNTRNVLVLMKECAQNRRNWIKSEQPPVSDIIQQFPALMDPSIVSLNLYNLYIHLYIHFQIKTYMYPTQFLNLLNGISYLNHHA